MVELKISCHKQWCQNQIHTIKRTTIKKPQPTGKLGYSLQTSEWKLCKFWLHQMVLKCVAMSYQPRELWHTNANTEVKNKQVHM